MTTIATAVPLAALAVACASTDHAENPPDSARRDSSADSSADSAGETSGPDDTDTAPIDTGELCGEAPADLSAATLSRWGKGSTYLGTQELAGSGRHLVAAGSGTLELVDASALVASTHEGPL